jgi:hypothetical protein
VIAQTAANEGTAHSPDCQMLVDYFDQIAECWKIDLEAVEPAIVGLFLPLQTGGV